MIKSRVMMMMMMMIIIIIIIIIQLYWTLVSDTNCSLKTKFFYDLVEYSSLLGCYAVPSGV
jgi:hypothetical protein